PVGPAVEPLRMLLQPRMVGRALYGEVERDLDPELARARDQTFEVLERPQLGIDPRVPTLLGADRPRTAGIARPRHERAVAALAVRVPDRVDGRQVEDVEPELREVRENRPDALEPAPRAREELVPGAEAPYRAIDVDLERVGRGHAGAAAGR